MTRLLDANTLYSGAEPKIVGDLTRLQLMKALNWYSQNKDAKDSLKWALLCSSSLFSAPNQVNFLIGSLAPEFGGCR